MVAYDAARNTLYLYGGQDGSADPCSTFSDVWYLVNANGLGNGDPPLWFEFPEDEIINNNPLDPPAGQNGASGIYDPIERVITVFGGARLVNGVCTDSNAVWQLSGFPYVPIWTNIIPEAASGSPPARSFASGVYDGTGGRMLLFGGVDGSGNYLNDVWSLSNATGLGTTNWSMLSPGGGPPATRSSQAAVFDSANQRMTIFAGSNSGGVLNDTWVLTSPSSSGLSCSATVQNPHIAPAEGVAELVGDFILNCTGGTPTPQGEPIPEYTITLTLNTNITSRVQPEAAEVSEALLSIDEPFPTTPSPSSGVPVNGAPTQILCTPLGGTCAETGTGGSPSPYRTQPNIFVGTQASPTSLSWTVPIDPPGVNAIRIIRLTNVRANAYALGAGSNFQPIALLATVGIQGSQAVPIAGPQEPVALGEQGAMVTVNAAGPISECAPHNAGLVGGSGTAAFDFNVQVQEGFAAAFKYRNYGTNLIGPVFPPQLAEQNVFGVSYNNETGFYSPSLFTTDPTLGLADSGTRIRVELQGVAAGTRLFVPVTINLQTNCSPPFFCDPEMGELQLVQADQNGLSLPGYEPVAATATIGTTPVAEVNYSGSAAYAIYEVINADPNQVELAMIPVAVAFNTSPRPVPGVITIDTSFAPLSSVMTADLSAPLPRFVDFTTSQPAYTINSCPSCTYSLTPSSVNIAATGGSGSFTVATPDGCPIQAATLSNFVSFTVAGSTLHYTVGVNLAFQPRTATITVGGQTFTISQAGAFLNFTPSHLTFTSGPVAAPQPQTVNVSGFQGTLSVSVNVPWATVTSSSQQLPATLTVTVSPVGLQPGNHSGTITLNVDGALLPYVIPYVVQGLPSLVPVPAQLTFIYSGGAVPASQLLEIYSTSPVAFQAAGSGFVSVTPSSGTTTQRVTVSVDPSGLTAGVHSASVTVTASAVTNSPLVIPVTLNVTSSGPQVTSGSIVNAASFQAGPLAPGSLFTVFGTNFTNSVSMTIAAIAVPL